jgi:hypothetical protein
MKKIKSLKQSTLLLLLIFTISCGKKPAPTTDANGLPFATQTGANTFGCLIDGVPCSVTGAYNWLGVVGVECTFGLDSILIVHAITSEPRKDFWLTCKATNSIPNTFSANKYVHIGYSDLNLNGGSTPGTSSYYQAIDSLPGTITITKFTGDLTNINGNHSIDIVSGTFDIVMQSAQNKKIHLTAGRFDIARQ